MRRRAPIALGSSPPISIITPAFAASWPSAPIASISALGGGPSGEFSGDLTIVMNFMVSILLVRVGTWLLVARELHLSEALDRLARAEVFKLEQLTQLDLAILVAAI